jgi:hypothetical protein
MENIKSGKVNENLMTAPLYHEQLFTTATGFAMLIHCDLLWIFEG